jgi:hypothetical protein
VRLAELGLLEDWELAEFKRGRTRLGRESGRTVTSTIGLRERARRAVMRSSCGMRSSGRSRPQLEDGGRDGPRSVCTARPLSPPRGTRIIARRGRRYGCQTPSLSAHVRPGQSSCQARRAGSPHMPPSRLALLVREGRRARIGGGRGQGYPQILRGPIYGGRFWRGQSSVCRRFS